MKAKFYLKAKPRFDKKRAARVVEYFSFEREAGKNEVPFRQEGVASEENKRNYPKEYAAFRAAVDAETEDMAQVKARRDKEWHPVVETPEERRARKREEQGVVVPPPPVTPEPKPRSEVKDPPDPPDYPVEPELVGVNPDYEMGPDGFYVKKKDLKVVPER